SPGTYYYQMSTVDSSGEGPRSAEVSATAVAAAVVGRHVFYNHSAFDGSDSANSAADDAAVATDKQALLPGQTATFANYTNYSKGINGLMIDLVNLAPGVALSASDFIFRVGNDNNPAGWASAPAPASITVRQGDGAYGHSDRIDITWADNAIRKTWLGVTIKADANTGLAKDDVFYFGNAIGDIGDHATSTSPNTFVNAADEL